MYDQSNSQPFDIFKIFVYNPKKPPSISEMLKKSKRPLIRFLGKLQEAKKSDESFDKNELKMILQTMQTI